MTIRDSEILLSVRNVLNVPDGIDVFAAVQAIVVERDTLRRLNTEIEDRGVRAIMAGVATCHLLNAAREVIRDLVDDVAGSRERAMKLAATIDDIAKHGGTNDDEPEQIPGP